MTPKNIFLEIMYQQFFFVAMAIILQELVKKMIQDEAFAQEGDHFFRRANGVLLSDNNK